MVLGPSSPDDSPSSPIGNTFSSPGDAARRNRRRGRSSTPSAFDTPPVHRSRFAAAADATPTPSRSRQRSGGAGRPPVTPTSTDDIPASSEGGDGFDMDDARPTFVWGTNISVEDVNDAIQRFLRDFREASSSQNDDDMLQHLHTDGKYEKLIKQVCYNYQIYLLENLELLIQYLTVIYPVSKLVTIINCCSSIPHF